MRYQVELSTYAVHGHTMPDGKFWEYGFAGWHHPYGEVYGKKAEAVAAAEKLDPFAVVDALRYSVRRPFRDMGEGWPQDGQGWLVRVYDTHTGGLAWKVIYSRFIPITDNAAKAA